MKNNKKICFFMRTPFSLGGEQRVVTVLSNYLVNIGYDVYFLLTCPNDKIDYEMYNMDKRIKILFIKKYNNIFNKIFRKIFYFFRYKNSLILIRNSYCDFIDRKILIKEFNKHNFDYIIGVSSEHFGILSVLKDKLINSKIIAWQHSTFESYFKTKNHRMFNQKSFIKQMMNNIDKYVVQTYSDKQKILNEFGIDAYVIGNPNTFNQNELSKLESKNFLSIGRFDYVKGFDMLIEAFSIFAQNNKEGNLYIVGEGKEKKVYEKLIDKYGLKDRIFIINKTNQINQYYLNSLAYIMTSRWEGWGMVVTEAMQFGLPIIGFDIPSTVEIFGDRECGILVEKFNIKKLANAIEEILSNNKKYEYSKNCIEQVKNFDIEKIGKKWIRILD